ncbi:MAG: DUF2203 family protein [Planctomycetota bacterium]
MGVQISSPMGDSSVAPKHEFDLEAARRVLPLVRAIVSDLARLQQRVEDREARLEGFISGRELTPGDPYADELAQMQADIAADKTRVREFIRELRDLGVVPDLADVRVVRFPAMVDDEPSWFCWRLGQPDVEYWMRRGADDGDWQPIHTESLEQDPSNR